MTRAGHCRASTYMPRHNERLEAWGLWREDRNSTASTPAPHSLRFSYLPSSGQLTETFSPPSNKREQRPSHPLPRDQLLSTDLPVPSTDWIRCVSTQCPGLHHEVIPPQPTLSWGAHPCVSVSFPGYLWPFLCHLSINCSLNLSTDSLIKLRIRPEEDLDWRVDWSDHAFSHWFYTLCKKL